MVEKLVNILSRHASRDGVTATVLPRVHLLRSTRATEPIQVLHRPAVCFVAQGRKQTLLGEHVFGYQPSQFLIISAELPVTGQILEASPEKPYLCFRLDLDPLLISGVIQDAWPEGIRDEQPHKGVAISDAPSELLDAVVRLASLLDVDRASDRHVLAPLAEREIIYRLLMGEQAQRMHQIAFAESKLSRINQAIAWIKENYAKALSVEDVAARVNMSTSSFHEHFRTITSMSPLQYQKQIRLQEARRLMLGQALDAATAAFTVGYLSPSQFSREYSRHFGLPPRQDIEKMRSVPVFA